MNVLDDIDQLPDGKNLLLALCDGKALTTTEINRKQKTNFTEEVLENLVEKGILKSRVEHRRVYYFLSGKTMSEALKLKYVQEQLRHQKLPQGMKYCRHCYRHLAGFLGVKIENALVNQQILIRKDDSWSYEISEKGTVWFKNLGIDVTKFETFDRKTVKQCLDFSERKSHLGGKLGDALLACFFQKGFVIQIDNSREIQFTTKGKQFLEEKLGLSV